LRPNPQRLTILADRVSGGGGVAGDHAGVGGMYRPAVEKARRVTMVDEVDQVAVVARRVPAIRAGEDGAGQVHEPVGLLRRPRRLLEGSFSGGLLVKTRPQACIAGR
jgi:hypothetical protein